MMLTVKQATAKNFTDRKLAVKLPSGKWVRRYGIADTYDKYSRTVIVKSNRGWPYKGEIRVPIDTIAT